MNHESVKEPPPLTNLIYGILGLTFLYHKNEGLGQIAREDVYSILSTLSKEHPEYFPGVYFTKCGTLMHSKQVEDALFHLGGVVNELTPQHKYLVFDENELKHVEKILQEHELFTVEDREIVEKLAEEFYKALKKHD